MKIVVTGALGQLGREIMRQSCCLGHVFVFTDVRDTRIDVSGNAFDVISMDISDPSAVSEVIDDVDVIINCAAYTDVNAAEREHELALRINVTGPAVLAAAACRTGALLIHVSTDYVFDGRKNVPYLEDDRPDPLNFYGLTKLQGEQKIVASGCRYIIFRTSWMYSIFGKNFFLTMSELTSQRPELRVVCDQTGTPTSAHDLAFLMMHIIENGMLDKTGIYNYSNEGTCTWYDFAVAINEYLGHTCRVQPCRTEDFPSPAVRPAYSVLDKTKVKKAFDIEVPYWRDSLELVVQEYFMD